MNPLTAAIAPYLLYIKLGLAALVLSVVFYGGCAAQKNRDEADITRLKGSLRNAVTVLHQTRTVLEDVNRRTNVRKTTFKAMLVRAEKAEEAAERAEEQLNKRKRDFDARLARASKKIDCATLLNTNVEAVCGL